MKKIGIITYHCVCNFGAQLQTVSTIGFLKRKGYEPIVIHWYPKDLNERYQKEISAKQYDVHIKFAKENMPLTKLCRTENELLQIIEDNEIDAIILGSDALFKYIPMADRKVFSKRKLKFVKKSFQSDQEFVENPFWGYFIPRLKRNIPVAGFSVSAQNAPYYLLNKQEYSELKRLLSQFRYISVRDEWTKQMVQHIMGSTKIPVTPDPVFSFNQNTYLAIPSKEDMLKKYNIPDNYVLLSFRLNYQSNNYIKKIAIELETKGYTAVAFSTPKGLKTDYGLKYKITPPLSPLDWYYLIKFASGYIGELMHPILVSLHNAVPFFSFDEYGISKNIIPFINNYKKHIRQSSKIYDILSKVDLLENMTSIYVKDNIPPKIVVHKLLSFDKNKVTKFSKSYQDYYEKSMTDILKTI